MSSNASKNQQPPARPSGAAAVPADIAVGAGAPAATAAFRELEQLVRHLGEELAGFRKRALQAEARLKTAEAEIAAAATASRAPVGDAPHPRVVELERENDGLRRRLDDASLRTRQMIDRVRFLRQQHHQASGGEK